MPSLSLKTNPTLSAGADTQLADAAFRGRMRSEVALNGAARLHARNIGISGPTIEVAGEVSGGLSLTRLGHC